MPSGFREAHRVRGWLFWPGRLPRGQRSLYPCPTPGRELVPLQTRRLLPSLHKGTTHTSRCLYSCKENRRSQVNPNRAECVLLCYKRAWGCPASPSLPLGPGTRCGICEEPREAALSGQRFYPQAPERAGCSSPSRRAGSWSRGRRVRRVCPRLALLPSAPAQGRAQQALP